MSSLHIRSVLLLAGSSFAALSAPAHAQQAEVHPYIEVQQVLDADLETGDTLTYTNVVIGADGTMHNERTQIQVTTQYMHTFGYQDGMKDSDTITGIVRGQTQIMPGLLNLEGGALATQMRMDGRGPSFGNSRGSPENTISIFSGYLGPRFQTNVGDLGLTAGYTFGYSRSGQERGSGYLAGEPAFSSFDNSTTHSVYASLAQSPGKLPFGWVVSGNWEREDMGQLDQRYDAKYARVDVTVPVTGTFALVGGVGYEDIKVSSRDALRDGAGNPVADSQGHYKTDKSSAREIAYQTDGLIYDAGVMWKPSPRTSVEARVGKRYGSTTYTATGSWQFASNAGFAFSVYDGIESFGRETNQALSRIPTAYNVARSPFGNGLGSCAYGQNGVGGACFNSFGSVPGSNFRARGVQAMVAGGRGPMSWGIGAGYQRNRYLMPGIYAAGIPTAGTEDEMWYVQGNHSYTFDNRSMLNVNAYANWYNSGIAGAPTVLGLGTEASYSYRFTNRFSASTSVGAYYYDADQFGDTVQGSALLALRYGL